MAAADAPTELRSVPAEKVGSTWVKRIVAPLIGIAVGLVLWAIIDSVVASTGFPGPVGVIESFGQAVTGRELYHSLSISLRRILLAWSISFLAGVLLGLVVSSSRVFNAFVRPWMLVGLALPSAVSVLLAVLFFGLSETSALVGLILVTTPFVVNIVHEAAASMPRSMVEMAKAYDFGRRRTAWHVTIPYLMPALLAAARLSFQLSWKEVVVMEAIVRPNGMGERMSFYYELLQADRLVAFTLVFAIILVAIEFGVLRPIGRYASRWRGSAAVL